MLSFPPFRLDVAEEQLWKGTKLLAVRRKPFAILRYLATHPRRLVTHDELLKEVWAGAIVSESSVRTHLHDLRQLLGEGVIETVIGRGYRFVGEIAEEGTPVAAAAPRLERLLVGRDEELGVLAAALERAQAGHRQLVFVTGEPGIGKTTLVDAFLETLGTDVFAMRGSCIEQHGAPEAYRPVIDMLGQLRHGKHAEQAFALLVRHAPTFLTQVPHLVPDSSRDEVMRRGTTGSDAKVVRELIELFEAVSTTTTHVLVLEDLQWSDLATIDMLSLMGQRRERAKLVVIATSRRAEAQTVAHPLNRVMRALVARSGAIALPVERLRDVGDFIAMRFPNHALPPAFVATIESITAGTPLFLAAMLDDLVARGMIEQRDGRFVLAVPLADVAAHRPDNVKQLIDIQLDRLSPPEQRLLEVASLVGPIFSTALVAAALELAVEQVDEACDSLARRALFLQHEGTEDWPDGSQQSCYGFGHGLVRDVCAERSAPARRQRWHRVIAERLEAVYGDRAIEVSSILATHFEQGQVVARAIHYHILAGARMVRRFASADALPSYRAAQRLLERLPASRERDATEVRILGGMSSVVLRMPNANDNSIANFQRMIALAKQLGDPYALLSAMTSIAVRYATLGRYQDSIDVHAELSTMAPLTPGLQAARALPLFWQGKLVETIALLEPLTRPDVTPEADRGLGILDPASRKTVLMSYLGVAYWAAGRADRGLAQITAASEIALASGDPYTIGLTRINIARIRFLLGDPPALIRPYADEILARPDTQMWHTQASLLHAWIRSTETPLGDGEIDDILRVFHERFAELPMGASYVALHILDAMIRSDLPERALAFADETLGHARRMGELMFEPELVRVRARLVPNEADLRTAYTNAKAMGAWGIAIRIARDLDDSSLVEEAAARILR